MHPHVEKNKGEKKRSSNIPLYNPDKCKKAGEGTVLMK